MNQNLNIFPNPIDCADKPGGVNSVVFDHAAGFLASGLTVDNKANGLKIVHALAETDSPDVFHCHGLYPIGNGYFDERYSKANDTILRNALRAKVTICVSEFAANILRHKLHIDPIVIRNGVWLDEYTAGGSALGPVLFPKAALDANAKPDEMLWLKENTDLPLLSIARIPTVKSLGPLPRDMFVKVLHQCSVYLATTKENSSMATMEAMLSGVPVVGYDTGFNSEQLESGNGCELVAKGDIVSLNEAIRKVRANWQRYSKQARSYAQIFDWQPVIDKLIGIYSDVEKQVESKSVSIVIPVHNYGIYLAQAVESALAQTIHCEVIVVDDKSTDNSVEVARKFAPKGVIVVENDINLGVAETRNKGIARAKGNYIVCLDADDYLLPNFVEEHLKAFTDRQVAITYAPINLVDARGEDKQQRLFRQIAQPRQQAVGKNQVPSCCMFRKEFWTRASGYDKRYTPAEDANLWLKIFSLGGKAVQASSKSLMNYRTHGDSLSAKGEFPDWWNGYPSFETPIQERDAEVDVVVTDTEDLKGILWQLENQKNPKWNCRLANPDRMEAKKSFPWLSNTPPMRTGNVMMVMPGMQLHPDFITQSALQIPPWVASPRYQ